MIKLEEENVHIKNAQGETLVGLATFPEDRKKKYPVVVLVHGFDVEKTEGGFFDEFAASFSKVGLLTFRFDFSGCGESGGDYKKTSLTKLRGDLAKIIEYVKSLPFIDSNKVGVLAQSFGTSISVALTPDIKCLVLMGSLAHPKKVFIDLFDKEYNPTGTSKRVRSGGNVTAVDSRFWPDFDKYDLPKKITEFNCPILFIYGEKDDKVPLSEMETYYEAAKNPKEKFIIEGADHGLRPHRQQAYKKALKWFQKHLTGMETFSGWHGELST